MNLSTTDLKLKLDSAVDLHLHTTFSDGRWTLDGLIDHLIQEQFDLAAIADHDRTDTLADIQHMALEKNLPVLVAVEMTTTWRGEMVDLLCFGFDPNDNALNNLTLDLLRRQRENTHEAFEYLQQKGCTFSADTLPQLLAKPSSVQPHALIASITEHGYDLGDPEVRKTLKEAGITFAMNDPVEVVEAARQSGAVCLLAHPGHKDGFVTFDVPLIDQFREEAPIDGLEVYHPKHSPDQTEMYLEYTQRHNLLVSAGSDSHDPDKPPIKYRAELIRSLLAHLGIQMQK